MKLREEMTAKAKDKDYCKVCIPWKKPKLTMIIGKGYECPHGKAFPEIKNL